MEHNLSIELNEYLPLRDVVFNTLRKAIITGEFAPGERLMEIALAKQLDVSRTPVREAIRMLELEGLVTMIPRKGAQVAQITEKSLRDVIEIRITLEELAASLACQRITAEDKENLKTLHIDFVQAVDTQDILLIAQKDEQFHDGIFKAADNQRLVNIINNLREQFYRYRLEYVKDMASHSNLIVEHQHLLDAISQGNTDIAKNIMRQHLLRQQHEVLAAIHRQESKN